MPQSVLYLHGFASSVGSSKAAFFADRFAAHGVPVVIPDFNEPDFEHLTITRMLDQVRAALAAMPPGPTAVIGSSLGAFVAVHAAAAQATWDQPARIDRLVLLAPALDFGRVRFGDLGDAALARWRASGRLDVFHHAFGRTMPLHYGLYEDAGRYDATALSLGLPILIFQGTRDTVVDSQVPVRWATGRANVRITFLDDDHQLLASLETIWDATFRFLQVDHTSADTLSG
jgi:alpha-beta hydrolase superfamily lysophospholipase